MGGTTITFSNRSQGTSDLASQGQLRHGAGCSALSQAGAVGEGRRLGVRKKLQENHDFTLK